MRIFWIPAFAGMTGVRRNDGGKGDDGVVRDLWSGPEISGVC